MDSAERISSEAPRIGTARLISTACELVCKAAIVAMICVVFSESVARTIFNYSFGISEEIGGYLLIALTFFSLPVGYAKDHYSKITFLYDTFGENTKWALRLLFDMLTLLICVVLLWQFGRLELQSWNSGQTSLTALRVPLWIPRLAMVLGVIALFVMTVAGLRSALRRGD